MKLQHGHKENLNTFCARFHTLIPPRVQVIVDRLKAHGFQAYVVGGALRDAWLRRSITDWDVATSAPCEDIKRLFEGFRFFSLKMKTVTLVHDEHRVELTPFRGSGRTIREDLAHRDFTINAMAYDPGSREWVDPLGGVSDLKRKCLRAVLSPARRFQEDPLRLLRAIRISGHLAFRLDPSTKKAMSALAPGLTAVSAERIRDEFMDILMGPRPSRALQTMHRTGLMKIVLPELLEGVRMKQNPHHAHTVYRHILETTDRVEADPVMRLTALLHDIAKPRVRKEVKGHWHFSGHEEVSARMAQAFLARLKFSRKVIDQVSHLVRHHMIFYDSGWTDAAVRRLIRRAGEGCIRALIRFRCADQLARGTGTASRHAWAELEKRVEQQLERHGVLSPGTLAIDGRQVMEALNMPPGPQVGRVLKALSDRVTECPELNDAETLMALLQDGPPR